MRAAAMGTESYLEDGPMQIPARRRIPMGPVVRREAFDLLKH